MKALFASALLALTPALVLAVPSASKSGTSVKKTAAVKAKPSQKVVVAKADTGSHSNRGRAVAVGAAAVGAGALGAAALASTPAAAASLSPEALSVAERVHTGTIACELGASVRVTADPQAPGHFHVDGKGFKYHMAPVATTTGTVRLEDQKAGAVWLQIANKSMLMDQKRGQRLADECMSPEQYQVAQAIKKNPPPSVLDAQPTATR